MSGWRVIAVVARREIREGLRNRSFLAATVVLLALIAAAPALNAALASETTYRVAVTKPPPPGLDSALRRSAMVFDANVRLRVLGSMTSGRRALMAEDVDVLLVLKDDWLIFRGKPETELAAITNTAVRALRRQGTAAPGLTSVWFGVPDAESDAAPLVALGVALLLLVSLVLYGHWVAVSIVTGRENRDAQSLPSTVQTRHLLAGKVIGIGLLALAQLAVVSGLAAALLAAGVFDAPAALGASILLVVPWFALGFALYGAAYASVSARASSQQNADVAVWPVTCALVVAYFAGYFAVAADSNGILAHVVTVFPPTAPLMLPARSVLVGVPLWEHALALALVLAAIYALTRFVGHVGTQGVRPRSASGVRAARRLTQP